MKKILLIIIGLLIAGTAYAGFFDWFNNLFGGEENLGARSRIRVPQGGTGLIEIEANAILVGGGT